MTHHRSAVRRSPLWLAAALVLFALGLLAPSPAQSVVTPKLGQRHGLPNLDIRTGRVAPTAAQLSAVRSLGATARWTKFGTPQSLAKYGGYLATGLTGDAATAARSWIRANRALFRLSDADVTNLQVEANSPLFGTAGRVVMFRQRLGGLASFPDGLINVGIRNGSIFYVSSSAVGSQVAPGTPTLTAMAAWVEAAKNVGRPTSVTAIKNIRQRDGWTVFSAAGFYTPLRTGYKRHGAIDQLARLVALPTPAGVARAAYHVFVLDATPGRNLGYEMYVDARTGDVIKRINAVMHADQAKRAASRAAAPRSGSFSGSTPDVGRCGTPHPILVDAANRSIDIVASAVIPTDDITLTLRDPLGTIVVNEADSLTSPEAIHYALAPTHPVGNWTVQVCEFEEVTGFDYEGQFVVSDASEPNTGFPAWKFFGANPLTGDFTPIFNYPNSDTRLSACWRANVPVPSCDLVLDSATEPNLAARAPWDVNAQTGVPTFTTIGNAAVTAEAWTTFLTPGPFGQRPVDFDRTYGYNDLSLTPPENWTNQWNATNCGYPTALTSVQRNDIMAGVTNLFAGHNRHHDWTYYLGFREENFNLQTFNFGRGGLQNDPEIGNVQNGALLPAAAGLTRDNANQFIVPDGVPGITNQFLFQPLTGFYAPCVDGDLDAIIYGHEYGHIVHNRMAAGPISGINASEQGGAMSESWGDQNGIEYTLEYNFVPPGQNPWAVGVYADGNNETGIRNYELGSTGGIGPGNPLNYGNYGYDLGFGVPEIHSDGEIWNAANVEIRQALVAKYNALGFPESDKVMQKRCADGVLPADRCPGNRRWIQLQYDSYLLLASSTPSMLDARDAFLQADVNRFGGANLPEIWRALAVRGFGESASSVDGEDVNPKPGFDSPFHPEGTVTFDLRAGDQGTAGNRPPVEGQVYVGHYEGGDTDGAATPVADTIGATPLGPTASFVGGKYQLVIRAKGYGIYRYNLPVTAGQTTTRTIHLFRNWASTTNGATATSSHPATTANLLDDTENTSMIMNNVPGTIPTTKPFVTVALGGGSHTVRMLKISGVSNGGRFVALRRFEIQTCHVGIPTVANTCTAPTDFTTIYTAGPNNAAGCVIGPPCKPTRVPFKGVAPRPVVPDMLWKPFDVPDTQATHVRLVALDNQCTGAPEYQGDQDPGDPSNNPNCSTSANNNDLRFAEIQVDELNNPGPPIDPAVVLTKKGPATATQGSTITYSITYKNAGPHPASSAKLTDVVPSQLSFVSASNGGGYDAAKSTVTWNLGTVPVNGTATLTLKARVKSTVSDGTAILNQAEFTAPNTFALPAAWFTVVT